MSSYLEYDQQKNSDVLCDHLACINLFRYYTNNNRHARAKTNIFLFGKQCFCEMGWLSIFAVIRHFYFNYNYTDSNLPYIHSLFSRRAKYAIQMTISFLVSGFLGYGTSLKTQVPQPFIIPLITVLSIQDSLGLTLAASFQMIITLVPVSVFIYIVQKIGLSYHDYIAAEFALLISAFFIGFAISQVYFP